MNEIDRLEQQIKELQVNLNITNNDKKEIDVAFENWIANKLNDKLKEKGWIQNEKSL